jgi:hypothetical protein
VLALKQKKKGGKSGGNEMKNKRGKHPFNVRNIDTEMPPATI